MAAVFVLSAWLTVSTVSYFGSRSLLTDKVDLINRLQVAYADLVEETRVTIDRVDALQETKARQEATIDELRRVQKSLARRLHARERELSRLAEERDRAVERASDLEDVVDATGDRLERLRAERRFVGEQLETVQGRLAEVSYQRDAGRRAEQRLRWQLARSQRRVEALEHNRETAQQWFENYVANSVEALEELFDSTGIDLEALVARAADREIGQGGPFQGIGPEPPRDVDPDGPISDDIERLSALQKLASSLPLTPPLDHFHITSNYGKRKDPFTKDWAFHGGIDFGADRGAAVMATAPGKVTVAGRSGPYGNMIEIDHGMGVTTRYGHLESVDVTAGEDVGFRQPIGIIGSTGRSTSRHLHYEVRIDDQAHDPAKFLEAGRYLIDAFNFKPSTSGSDKTADAS